MLMPRVVTFYLEHIWFSFLAELAMYSCYVRLSVELEVQRAQDQDQHCTSVVSRPSQDHGLKSQDHGLEMIPLL